MRIPVLMLMLFLVLWPHTTVATVGGRLPITPETAGQLLPWGGVIPETFIGFLPGHPNQFITTRDRTVTRWRIETDGVSVPMFTRTLDLETEPVTDAVYVVDMQLQGDQHISFVARLYTKPRPPDSFRFQYLTINRLHLQTGRRTVLYSGSEEDRYLISWLGFTALAYALVEYDNPGLIVTEGGAITVYDDLPASPQRPATSFSMPPLGDIADMSIILSLMAMTPQGDRLAAHGSPYFSSANSHTYIYASRPVYIWELPSGEMLGALPTTDLRPRALAFSPNGQQLAAGGNASPFQLRLYDVERLSELRRWAKSGPVYAVAFNQEGTLLAGGISTLSVHIHDVATGIVPVILQAGEVRWGM